MQYTGADNLTVTCDLQGVVPGLFHRTEVLYHSASLTPGLAEEKGKERDVHMMLSWHGGGGGTSFQDLMLHLPPGLRILGIIMFLTNILSGERPPVLLEGPPNIKD